MPIEYSRSFLGALLPFTSLCHLTTIIHMRAYMFIHSHQVFCGNPPEIPIRSTRRSVQDIQTKNQSSPWTRIIYRWTWLRHFVSRTLKFEQIPNQKSQILRVQRHSTYVENLNSLSNVFLLPFYNSSCLSSYSEIIRVYKG